MKRPRGRPPLETGEKSSVITAHMVEREVDQVHRKAESARMTTSAYVREVLKKAIKIDTPLTKGGSNG